MTAPKRAMPYTTASQPPQNHPEKSPDPLTAELRPACSARPERSEVGSGGLFCRYAPIVLAAWLVRRWGLPRKGRRLLGRMSTGWTYRHLRGWEAKSLPVIACQWSCRRANLRAVPNPNRPPSSSQSPISQDNSASSWNGACGNGIQEDIFVLEFAQRLGHYCRARKAKTVFPRKADSIVPVGSRARRARRERAGLFASIHINAHDKESAHGAELLVVRGD